MQAAADTQGPQSGRRHACGLGPAAMCLPQRREDWETAVWGAAAETLPSSGRCAHWWPRGLHRSSRARGKAEADGQSWRRAMSPPAHTLRPVPRLLASLPALWAGPGPQGISPPQALGHTWPLRRRLWPAHLVGGLGTGGERPGTRPGVPPGTGPMLTPGVNRSQADNRPREQLSGPAEVGRPATAPGQQGPLP